MLDGLYTYKTQQEKLSIYKWQLSDGFTPAVYTCTAHCSKPGFMLLHGPLGSVALHEMGYFCSLGVTWNRLMYFSALGIDRPHDHIVYTNYNKNEVYSMLNVGE